jgi:outer membrane protein insertion porin family
MSAGKPFFYKNIPKIITAGWLMLAVISCTTVKNYQPGKPFVYKTNINLTGNFSKPEREALISRLKDQLDDSMKARSVSKVLWRVMKSPPLFDSINIDKSIISMRALLKSLGYFSDTITHSDTIKIFDNDQYRTTINFNVKPGKQVILDSISYSIDSPLYHNNQKELQAITLANKKESFIKKGDPFAIVPVSAELDRLVDLYRNNGYLRFTKDELKGYWDTLNLALLNPSLDPFEQIALLDSIKKNKGNTKANLEIRLRPGFDSTKLTKYYVGNIFIYPDYNQDTITYSKKETVVDGVRVIYYRKIFKPKILPKNIYFHSGDLYDQRKYFKTINRFSSLGAWSLINIDTSRRESQDTVDFHIRLTPAKKYSFTTNLEGSLNQSAYSGNLFGLAVSFNLQNRNFARTANQANTSVRYGIELGGSGTNQFIQTQQVSVSHNIYFPRAILFDKWVNKNDNWRTILSANAANIERRLLYNQTTLNTSWGYEFQKKNLLVNFKFPNIEYSFLDKKDSLNKLIKANPLLKNIFTDGLIFSVIGNLTLSGGKKHNLNIFRANFEGAPLLAGLFHNPFLDSQVYRFIKLDAEFARLIRYPKSSIALRFFSGIGFADPFNTTVNPDKQNALPFFKQYFSGGPNSMRAWALRQLGPGSTVKPFKDTAGIPERYGDVQLEANIEYRFPITSISGVQLNGAIFSDIGNVWLLKKAAGLPEEVFNFSRLGKDIAIGAGAGLRIDFNYFIIRLDYSYKVKDPSPSPEDKAIQNKWFGYKFFKGDQFQLGVRYPFIF